jgi:hypothetical protein
VFIAASDYFRTVLPGRVMLCRADCMVEGGVGLADDEIFSDGKDWFGTDRENGVATLA